MSTVAPTDSAAAWSIRVSSSRTGMPATLALRIAGTSSFEPAGDSDRPFPGAPDLAVEVLSPSNTPERIRAKGALAPGGLSNLATMAAIEEIAEDATAQEMVRHLVRANEKLLVDVKTARDLAGQEEDSETEDLMIGRVQIHEKTIWMLKSYLE